MTYKILVLEARDENQKLVGRAEYDNKKWTKRFMQEFENKSMVKSIRVTENEVETLKWEREQE